MFVIFNSANNSVVEEPLWEIPDHLSHIDISGCVMTDKQHAKRVLEYLQNHFKNKNIQLMQLVSLDN